MCKSCGFTGDYVLDYFLAGAVTSWSLVVTMRFLHGLNKQDITC